MSEIPASGSASSHANGLPAALSRNHDEEAKAPVAEDPMQIARLGDVEAMQTLVESGKSGPYYKDDEGITPLHVSFAAFLTGCASNIRTSGLLSTTVMRCADTY